MPQLIRFPEVVALTGRSRTRIYEDVALKRFPQPVKIGPRAVAFSKPEVLAWIEARLATREAA